MNPLNQKIRCVDFAFCQVCLDPLRSAEFRAAIMSAHGVTEWTCPHGFAIGDPAPPVRLYVAPAVANDNAECDGPPAADWCQRFGLPAGASGCAVCSTSAGEDRVWLLTQMRAIGGAYKAMVCPHRVDSGRREERKCCGGQVKILPIYVCADTGQLAKCGVCSRKIF
jgi:hypothetical protein